LASPAEDVWNSPSRLLVVHGNDFGVEVSGGRAIFDDCVAEGGFDDGGLLSADQSFSVRCAISFQKRWKVISIMIIENGLHA
jgi:hypothetical protein